MPSGPTRWSFQSRASRADVRDRKYQRKMPAENKPSRLLYETNLDACNTGITHVTTRRFGSGLRSRRRTHSNAVPDCVGLGRGTLKSRSSAGVDALAACLGVRLRAWLSSHKPSKHQRPIAFQDSQVVGTQLNKHPASSKLSAASIDSRSAPRASSSKNTRRLPNTTRVQLVPQAAPGFSTSLVPHPPPSSEIHRNDGFPNRPAAKRHLHPLARVRLSN